MPREKPDPQTIFHLVPNEDSVKAREILLHPDNEPFVSLALRVDGEGNRDQEAYGLEIGYHVRKRTVPQVITEVGRDADLILPGKSISQVHVSFEMHPESRQIILCDRSRLRNTKIGPVGFRKDGDFRQVVLQPGIKYCISIGGDQLNQYIFDLVWPQKPEDVLLETEKRYESAEASAKNPRYARTIEEGPTELPSWYNTRLHTPSAGAGGVQRTTEGKVIGRGAFGEVRKAVDLDSGCFIAVKEIELPPRVGVRRSNEETCLRREVKILSSISHKNIVEYLGSTGWDTGTVQVYMSLKAGNVFDLLKRTPSIGTDEMVLKQLLHQMLEALDYLAFRGLCHRDLKPQNILYTQASDGGYIFQLADFGLANHQHLAKTYCGTLHYMAPEVVYPGHRQSPKMDVWSLFVVIGVVTKAGGLHNLVLASYEDVLSCVKVAATFHAALSPMAREDPDTRASAAQMLVKHFGGQGLSTPRHQVGPISDPATAVTEKTDSEQHELHSRPKAPKLEVARPAAVNLRMANQVPLKRLGNGNVPQRNIPANVLNEIARQRGSLDFQRFS